VGVVWCVCVCVCVCVCGWVVWGVCVGGVGVLCVGVVCVCGVTVIRQNRGAVCFRDELTAKTA